MDSESDTASDAQNTPVARRSSLERASMDTPKFTFAGVYAAKCVKVYDGDTIQVVFCFAGTLSRFSIRMYGYNSAEIKSHDAEEKAAAVAARDALASLILGKIVDLEVLGEDKYGRLLGEVSCADSAGEKINVNKWMLKEGHGKEYYGEGEKNW